MKTRSIIKSTTILFVAALFLTACGSKDNKKAKEEALSLYQQSMKVHDEVMPRMDELFRMENALKALRDSLSVDTVTNAARLTEIKTGIASLKNAGKGMMDWMHNIQGVPGAEENERSHHHRSSSTDTLTDEQLLKIQEDQKTAIDQVKIEMEESITRAKKILNKK